MNVEEIREFMRESFPQAKVEVLTVGNRGSMLRQEIDFSHLRPGGTVSGPTLMGLADAALYVAILGEIGLVALAVTTNLNINFLRKPSAERALVAECRLIKLGKVLAVGEVHLYSEGSQEPVAHVTGTYSIPPQRSE